MRYATSSWLNVQVFKLINLFLLITTCWGRYRSSEKRIWDMDHQRWCPFSQWILSHIFLNWGLLKWYFWHSDAKSVCQQCLQACALTASSCQGWLTLLLAQLGTHILFYLALEKTECFTSSAWDDHNKRFNQPVKTDPPWHRFYDVSNKTVTLLHWLFNYNLNYYNFV